MKQSLPEFIRCWKDSELTERQGSQSHFNDLCDILNEPHPAHADPGRCCTATPARPIPPDPASPSKPTFPATR
jgi:hypothetical protein